MFTCGSSNVHLACDKVMSSDPLSDFGCLDELIQVIYQSVNRFVVLSTVSDDKWNIHLGLSGPEGRWWHGSWTAADVVKVVGSKASDHLIESFAEKLAEAFVGGELIVGNWSPDEGAEIRLTLGPTSKTPMHVPLVEMTQADAASHATNVFLEIALQAQSRKCKLHAPSVAYPPLAPSSLLLSADTTVKAQVDSAASALKSKDTPAKTSHKSKESVASAKPSKLQVANEEAQEEIKSLKAELDKQKNLKRMVSPPEKTAPTARHPKGASLANPNKKARKYQAIEFESDEE